MHRGQRREPRRIEPAERPHRGAANQRRAHRPAAARPAGASAGSPELPIAISTLRTKRSRPVRFTAVLANSARNAASSSRASSASFGARSHVARGELGLAAGLRELVPRADREAIVAAVDAVADQRAQLARDRALVLDGEVGDAAPRIEPVGRRETPRSGRRRGRRGRCRRSPAPAASGGSSSVVKIAPRNSHEPNSRDTRLVCLPCQPRPAAAASGFSITAAVSTNTFTSPPACAISQRASVLQPRLDDLVIVARPGRRPRSRRARGACRIASGSWSGP